MLKLRTMVTAFIFHEGKVLFIKRAMDRKLMPGGWAPIGGHIEPEELNDPQKACIREIYEETGLDSEDLSPLQLKYIMHRRKDNEIRIQYVFFCQSRKSSVSHNEEGELFWMDPEQVFEMDISATTGFLLDNYLTVGRDMEELLVGTVGSKKGSPQINWGILQDWE